MDCKVIDELAPEYFREQVGVSTSLQVLAIGSSADADRTGKYLALGCMGLVVDKRSLRKAVQAVAAGEIWASRLDTSRLLKESLEHLHGHPLTSRQREILRLIATGMKNADIAAKLGVCHETIRWHIRQIYSKIGVENRASAVAYGRRFFSADGAETFG